MKMYTLRYDTGRYDGCDRINEEFDTWEELRERYEDLITEPDYCEFDAWKGTTEAEWRKISVDYKS